VNKAVIINATNIGREVLPLIPEPFQPVFGEALTSAELYAYGYIRLEQVKTDDAFEAISQVFRHEAANPNGRHLEGTEAAYTILNAVMTAFDPKGSFSEVIVRANRARGKA